VHFLLIGAALFVLFYRVADPEAVSDNRIPISEADVDRMVTLFERRWRRLPSQGELDGLVEAQIREEILYREALAMGLDQDDTIVRRRMAQKMEFMFEDLVAATAPSDEELEAFLREHSDRFLEPPRTTFVQVYLSTDQRGEHAEADARRLLETLRASSDFQDPSVLRDPSLLGHSFAEQSDQQVASQFAGRTLQPHLCRWTSAPGKARSLPATACIWCWSLTEPNPGFRPCPTSATR
jgi:hypothetical protein